MKITLLLFAAILFVGLTADAQFTTWQAADIVLGQPDFTTATNPPSASNTTMVPYSVAVDGANSKLFVADENSNRVLRWNTSGVGINDPAEAVFGQPLFTTDTASVTQLGMDTPLGVCMAPTGTTLFVAEATSNRITRFDNAYNITSGSSSANAVLGEPDFNTGGGGTTNSTVTYPYAVAIDATGHLYVADHDNNRVLRFNNAASLTNGSPANGVLGARDFTHAGSGTCTDSTMFQPSSVAIDKAGTLYVADQGNNRVLRFLNAANKANGGKADGVIGQASFTAHISNGHGPSNLISPYGVAVDGAKRLYVSDQGNNRILCYDSVASITGNLADSVLGQPSLFLHGFNTTQKGLSSPAGIAIDVNNGYLWVADLGNYRVLRYTASFAPLPVELTTFTAAELNGKVELAWKTATEINNSGFEVQRITIGNQHSTMNNWTKVAFVAGHGTTNAPQNYSYTDGSVSIGKYSYRLKQIDNDGKFVYGKTIETTVGITPGTVYLNNNYPNPFNPSTKISFVLGTKGHAALKVFNLLGQEVATLADGEFNDGETQTFTFDASKFSSGIYYYELRTGSTTQIKKMMLLK
jgi:sugar lactone lactonase YvrE